MAFVWVYVGLVLCFIYLPLRAAAPLLGHGE